MSKSYGYELREAPRAVVNAPYPAPSYGDIGRMAQYLDARGLSYEIAAGNFWYPTRNGGDDSPRIIIPATCRGGRQYWQARAMDENPIRYRSPLSGRAEAVVVVWPPEPSHKVVICEGPMDALAAAGCRSIGVAVMGRCPSVEALSWVNTLFSQDCQFDVVSDGDSPDAASKWVSWFASQARRARLKLPAPFKDLCEAPAHFRERMLWP